MVDDEKSIADVTTGMLEPLGDKVTVRISSHDALEAFRNLADHIDLPADLAMPQMTGLQLYREIKKIWPDIKVIICIGFSEQLDSGKSKVIGIEGYLNKPVGMADLARCVRSVLDGYVRIGRYLPRVSRSGDRSTHDGEKMAVHRLHSGDTYEKDRYTGSDNPAGPLAQSRLFTNQNQTVAQIPGGAAG